MKVFVSEIFLKRIVLRKALVLILVLSVGLSASPARAGYWGESLMAVTLDQLITTIKSQIEGAILGTLKVAAVTMLNSKVGQMVGGSSAGNSMIISDWDQFLYQAPAEKVNVYMNDFFSSVTQGKYASANYVGVGDTQGDVNGGYVAYLVGGAQQSIGMEGSAGGFQYNLDEFSSSPEQIFQNGDWRGFNAFVSNPMNNPWGFQIATQGVFSEQLAKEQKKADVKSKASGFKAPEAGGKTVAPVATIEGMVKDTQNIGNQIIAAAKNPGEFLSGVVGALVNKTITNLVQRGVGQVQANIKREIGNFDKKVTAKLNQVDKQLGPAAKYLKTTSQRVDTQVKPYTSPPPAAGSYCGDGRGAC